MGSGSMFYTNFQFTLRRCLWISVCLSCHWWITQLHNMNSINQVKLDQLHITVVASKPTSKDKWFMWSSWMPLLLYSNYGIVFLKEFIKTKLQNKSSTIISIYFIFVVPIKLARDPSLWHFHYLVICFRLWLVISFSFKLNRIKCLKESISES